jgi:eukaryotic-like serine/threonine-protein kinase
MLARSAEGHRRDELGKYRLVAEIARGGMGIVYLAVAHGVGGFHKVVVIKELKPELAEDGTFLQMFLEEARLAARLNHPNIVQTNEVGSTDNRYFMAMEYLEGRTLNRVIRRYAASQAGFPVALHLRVLREVLRGLHYAHNLKNFDGTPLGIVHRDVSPQNIFLTFDGQVKVLDFGIAKAADSALETKAGVLKGKVSYMAPEQLSGVRADARADVFSVGVMLWEAIVGRRLWEGMGDLEILKHLVKSEIPSPRAFRPDVPDALERICMRALAGERDQRYATAAELEVEIAKFAVANGLDATTREIDESMASVFAEDRRRMDAQIEAHLARAREDERDESSIPTIAPLAGSMTPSGKEAPFSSTKVLPAPPKLPGFSASNPSPAMTPSDQASLNPPAAPSTWRRRSPAPLIAATVIVCSLAAASVALRRGPVLPPPTPVASVAPPIAPPEAVPTPGGLPPAPNNFELSIRASPSSAQLLINDEAVRGNPYVGTYPAGTALRVRATAPGYMPKSEELTANGNTAITLTLDREPRAASSPQRAAIPPPRPPPPAHSTPVVAPDPPPKPPPPPPPPAPVATDVNPNGGKRPRLTVDPTNPYGTAP